MFNMNNEQEQMMAAFIQWLPQNIQQFKGSLPKEIIEPIATAQSPEEVVNVLNQLSQSQEGNQVVSVMFQAFQESQKTGMFKKGGKLEQLLTKYQSGGFLRQRGKLNAYRGSYPKYVNDGTWTSMNGADIKNVFNGNTLEQNVVTKGINGIPRRSVRIITNYDMPAKSDTFYVDANGLQARRNPGFFQKLFGNVHTPEFMDSVDAKLVGAEPIQLSEREVKVTNLKRK